MMNDNSCLILLDVGGTYIKSALGEPHAGVIKGTFASTAVSSGGSKEDITNAFKEVVAGQLIQAEENGFKVNDICVAIPGPFDYKEGRFLMKHKYASVYGHTLRELLGDTINPNMRLAFIHDVNGALLGALASDPELSKEVVALTTLGTGLGFTYAVNGEIKESATGSPAISLWNQPYKDGILEDYVSRRGIINTYRSLGGILGENDDVKEISDRARSGEQTAQEAFKTTGMHYAAGARQIIEELRITKLLFGGQIAKSFDLMQETIEAGLGDSVQVSILNDIQETVLIGTASL